VRQCAIRGGGGPRGGADGTPRGDLYVSYISFLFLWRGTRSSRTAHRPPPAWPGRHRGPQGTGRNRLGAVGTHRPTSTAATLRRPPTRQHGPVRARSPDRGGASAQPRPCGRRPVVAVGRGAHFPRLRLRVGREAVDAARRNTAKPGRSHRPRGHCCVGNTTPTPSTPRTSPIRAAGHTAGEEYGAPVLYTQAWPAAAPVWGLRRWQTCRDPMDHRRARASRRTGTAA